MAEWKREKSLFILTCSECGCDVRTDSIWKNSGELNYCPNCGKPMTEKGEE